jgi:hypothetical protein
MARLGTPHKVLRSATSTLPRIVILKLLGDSPNSRKSDFLIRPFPLSAFWHRS